VLVALSAATVAGAEPAAEDARAVLSLLDAMERAWTGIADYTAEVDKTERLIDGRVTRQRVLLKFRRPGDYYLKVLEGPGKGGELIYPKDADTPVAVAHAGGFKGGLARFLQKTVVLRRIVPTEFSLEDPAIISGQHQTVLDTSPGATIRRISANIRAAIESGEGEIRLDRECGGDGACLIRMDVALPATAGSWHDVRAGETLWTIATDHDTPMYVIWYNNPGMHNPTDVEPGESVFVPRYYAASGSVWVSADSHLPVKVEILDAEGRLYERYVYSEIGTNSGLSDLDFDVSNPDYRF